MVMWCADHKRGLVEREQWRALGSRPKLLERRVGQAESDVDGSEVALTVRMSWWVSSALSFLYSGTGTFLSGVCFPWQSWVDAVRSGLRQTDR